MKKLNEKFRKKVFTNLRPSIYKGHVHLGYVNDLNFSINNDEFQIEFSGINLLRDLRYPPNRYRYFRISGYTQHICWPLPEMISFNFLKTSILSIDLTIGKPVVINSIAYPVKPFGDIGYFRDVSNKETILSIKNLSYSDSHSGIELYDSQKPMMYTCTKCGHLVDYYEFIDDWIDVYDKKACGPIATLICPNCGNSNEETILYEASETARVAKEMGIEIKPSEVSIKTG